MKRLLIRPKKRARRTDTSGSLSSASSASGCKRRNGTIFYKSCDPAVERPSFKWVNEGTDISLHLWLTTDHHRTAAEMEHRRNDIEDASAKPRGNCRKCRNNMMEV